MSFRRALAASRRLLSTAPQTTPPPSAGATSTASATSTPPQTHTASPWTAGMPTRAIAHVLLSKENFIAPHDVLYAEVNDTGVLRSHRHFKHCLKMLKDQKRVKVICLGPEKVGSNKRKFSVKLTTKGQATYNWFRKCYERQGNDGQPGLKDALP